MISRSGGQARTSVVQSAPASWRLREHHNAGVTAYWAEEQALRPLRSRAGRRPSAGVVDARDDLLADAAILERQFAKAGDIALPDYASAVPTL